jgi:hypothetical protein
MIVANDATATIGGADSTAVLLVRDQAPEVLPTMSKTELAAVILDRVATLATGHVEEPAE